MIKVGRKTTTFISKEYNKYLHLTFNFFDASWAYIKNDSFKSLNDIDLSVSAIFAITNGGPNEATNVLNVKSHM